MAEVDRTAARTEEDREFAAISDAAIWEEARDRLQICTEAEVDNRKRAKQALLFREGVQWDQTPSSSVSEDEIELTINLTDAMVTRVLNNIKQQRPRGKCHPVGEGADVELAEIINGIGRHVETRSEASVAYDTAADCAIGAGVGYFRLIAEYLDARSFHKDLRILPIRNIFTVSMDPGAIMPSGADQNWCLISLKMKRQEYKRRYPTAANVNWNDLSRDEQRFVWEDEEEVRLAEYFRIREKEEKLYLIRAADGSEMTRYHSELPRKEGDGRVVMQDVEQRFRERGARIEGSRDSIKRQVEWFRLNGLIVIERQQIPGTYIPIFRVEGNVRDIDGHVRRRGMVESMQDPQRMVNYGEVAKIKRLGLAPKAPWVAAEGQLDGHPEWDTANQKPHPVLTYKPIVLETSSGAVPLPPPQRQPPAQIEQGFAEFVQGMRSNLLAVAGMPNEPGQDREGVVVSGRAIKRRQWLSDQSHFQYYDNLTLAIAQCWRVMVEWIPFYFSEERMQRIIGEDSTPTMVKINEQTQEPGPDGSSVSKIKHDLSVGRYDVVMDTGPGYETKREEGAENLIDLLKVGPLAEIIAKQGSDLVFRSIDHPYMQELADRLMASNPEGLQKIMEGLSSRARSIVQSLWNQVQALQQQNQQLQQDLKGGITKAHLAAVTKAHDTNVMAQVKMHDTQTRADTEIAREMIEDQTWRFDIESKVHSAKTVEEIKGLVQLLLHHLGSVQAIREIEAQAQQSAPQPNGGA
jgi:polyhydroxyalkanoate synthesis regulator phasin